MWMCINTFLESYNSTVFNDKPVHLLHFSISFRLKFFFQHYSPYGLVWWYVIVCMCAKAVILVGKSFVCFVQVPHKNGTLKISIEIWSIKAADAIALVRLRSNDIMFQSYEANAFVFGTCTQKCHFFKNSLSVWFSFCFAHSCSHFVSAVAVLLFYHSLSVCAVIGHSLSNKLSGWCMQFSAEKKFNFVLFCFAHGFALYLYFYLAFHRLWPHSPILGALLCWHYINIAMLALSAVESHTKRIFLLFIYFECNKQMMVIKILKSMKRMKNFDCLFLFFLSDFQRNVWRKNTDKTSFECI